MDISELIKQVRRWVLGACTEWNEQVKQFADLNGVEFRAFVERTANVVIRYIRGQQTLDGSCSDLECTLAIEARHVFGWHSTSVD
jgi:hypothetical protein